MTPAILAIATNMNTDLSESAQKVVNALQAWDFECPTGLDGTNAQMSPLVNDSQLLLSSAGCAAFHAAIAELERAITADENKAVDSEDEPVPPPGRGPNYAAFYSIVDPSQLTAGDIYWDDIRTPAAETRFDIMGAALDTAGELLRAELGDDETEWAWGRLHGTILESDLAALGLANFNNPAPGDSAYANDGGLFTVDVANPNDDFTQTTGPSTRFVCEAAAERVSCSYQIPGGQSGDIDSLNYDDLLDKWLVNEPTELIYDIDDAAQNATRTIRLGQ
jgi:acyl-homoserine lactone acylase PvdQ